MNKKTTIFMLIMALIMTLTMAGCDERLESNRSMERQIKKSLPECEIISVENEANRHTYIINNMGIEFKLKNYLDYNPIFGNGTSSYSCNYLEMVLRTDEVSAFLAENGISFIWSSDSSSIKAYASNSSELAEIYNSLEELEALIYDYLPEKPLYNDVIDMYIYYGNDTLATEVISHKENIDWNARFEKALKNIRANEYFADNPNW